MIIVDFQQVVISNLMVSLGKHTNIEIEESLLRHMVLNSIRGYNVKFRSTYGEMTIACDGYNYWRKEINPYYKANRKKDRDESEIDWNHVFTVLNKIREELKEFFPYRVVHIEDAEADDVIGTLCHNNANTNEKILVISADKDFKQLQKYINVEQYDPINNRWLRENDPGRFLKEHIMRGDTSDGLCNFLSPTNSLVLGVRQKSVFQKKLDVWVTQEPEDFCDDEMLRRYRENEVMIDLDMIPEEIQTRITNAYDTQANKGRSKLFNYFIEHKLKNLISDIADF